MTHPAKLASLYETAKQLIVDTNNPIISLTQRRLELCFSRAVALTNTMKLEIDTRKDESAAKVVDW